MPLCRFFSPILLGASVFASVLLTLFPSTASAVPLYARQTGQSCVACHVGGMYPQLTAFGRMFKLTGYTMGNRPNLNELEVQNDAPPISVMLQGARQYYTNTSNGINGSAPSSAMDMQVISLFSGGKITDNMGAFIQWTQQKYSGAQTGTQWTGAAGIDNTELRYADRTLGPDSNLIYGAYINNRSTMSDVWNTTENWANVFVGFFNGGSPQSPVTFLDSAATQHSMVGAGAYLFKDNTWYGELAVYKSVTHGPATFLLTANATGVPLVDPSPYVRLAYNKEFGPHSFELGVHGMVSYAHNSTAATGGVSDWAGTVNTYRDVALDGQYQYVLDPHYFAVHARFSHENASYAADQIGNTVTNPTNILNETYLDATYIYKTKYGVMLMYQGATGSADATLNPMGPAGSPDWRAWTPQIFWAPWQNVRIGYQYVIYTQMGGTTGSNLNLGGGTYSPHDFNTSMLYASFIY